ncbi:MAG: SDR family oxidoreductase [Pseudomonadota bacterium]
MPSAGRKLLITGASRGIGEAAARAFAESGAQVMLAARSADDIARIATEITDAGGVAHAVACDVADARAMQAAVDATVDAFGGIDTLIANAGMLEPIGRIETLPPEGFAQVIDTNVNGVFYGIRAALAPMKAAGGGTVITIGSGAATSALEGWAHYSASKAAVHHLNSVLHKEEAENGIRALVLSPGTVATNMQRSIASSGINPVSSIPWEDHIPPDWPAKALMWMCTADADGWLGQVVSLREDTVRQRVGLI